MAASSVPTSRILRLAEALLLRDVCCAGQRRDGKRMSIARNEGGAERAFGPWKAADFETLAAAYGGTTISRTTAGMRMAKANAIRALQSDPRFAGFLLMRVMHRVRRLRARLISQLFESSEQRLARILLMLANCGGDRHETIVDKLDQEDLAQMVGTTRGRISHFMNKFRNLGYIDYDGDIAVHRSLSHVLAAEFGNPKARSKIYEQERVFCRTMRAQTAKPDIQTND